MKHDEKGTVVVLTAVLMVVMIVILGLAIDFGLMYTARTFAQHAADAGALAGAVTYANYPAATQAMATENAQQAAEQNKVLGRSLTNSNVTVTFPTASSGYKRVRVDVSTTASPFFLKILGSNWAQVSVATHAIGEAATGTVAGTKCLRPIWITKTHLLGGSCSNPTPAPGTAIKLWDSKVCSDSNNCPTSQWGLIDPVSLGYSASDISSWILSCSAVTVTCQSHLSPKTGAAVGVIGSGQPPPIQTLIGQSGSGNDWTWPSDIVGDYLYTPTHQTYSSSPAVINVAIWDDCTTPPGDGANQVIPIAGFADIFVDSITKTGSNKNIAAQFVDMSNSCSGSGGGGGGVTGPDAIPVRLIHPDASASN